MTRHWVFYVGKYSKPLVGALLTASALAFVVAYLQSGPQPFNQLAMGELAASGLSKAGELSAALVFIIAIPMGWFAFRGPMVAFRSDAQRPADWPQFFLLVVPIATCAGQVVSKRSLALEWALVCAVCGSHWLIQRFAQRQKSLMGRDATVETRTVALTAPPLVAFSVVGLATLWSRFAPFPQNAPIWPLALISASIIWAIWLTKRVVSVPRIDLRALAWSQLGVPLLALGLIPTPVATVYHAPTASSLALWCLIAVVSLIGILDLGIRARRAKSYAQCLSPVCVLLIVWSLRHPFTPFPTLPHDDWHFGEVLLPFWSFVDHGRVPYIDLMPVRGFVSGANALAAEVFFSGNADDVFRAAGLVAFLFMAVVFASTRAAVGMVPAVLVAGLLSLDTKFPIGAPDFLYLCAFYCVLAALVRERYGVALVTASALVIVLTLLMPGQALIFAVAASALVMFSIVRLIRAPRSLAIAILTSTLLLAVGFGLIQQSGLLGGIYKYFLDNASVNTIAHGLPWYAMLRAETLSTGLFRLEIVRAAVLPFTGLVLIVAWSALYRLQTFARTSVDGRPAHSALGGDVAMVLVVAIFIALTVTLSLPRALGRVDPGTASRLGQLTLLVAAGLMPALVLRVFDERRAAISLVFCVILAVAINTFMTTPLSATLLLNGQYRVTPVGEVIDGRDLSLHRVGSAVMDPIHQRHLSRLRTAVNELLGDGVAPQLGSPWSEATYYDMTNRNAHYFYLGRSPPTLWSSPYYLADERAQARTALELINQHVPLILLSANNIEHDGGRASHRAYWLYRTVLDHYVPFRSGGFIFAIKKEYADQPMFANKRPQSDVGTRALFEEVFALPNLAAAPASWGASINQLQARMATESLDVSNELETGAPFSKTSMVDKTDLAASKRFDLLVLTLACTRPTRAVIAWHSATGQTSAGSTQFLARAGTVIVPMGSFPSWILGPSETSLSLNAPDCKVKHAELRMRKHPESLNAGSQKTRSWTRNH